MRNDLTPKDFFEIWSKNVVNRNPIIRVRLRRCNGKLLQTFGSSLVVGFLLPISWNLFIKTKEKTVKKFLKVLVLGVLVFPFITNAQGLIAPSGPTSYCVNGICTPVSGGDSFSVVTSTPATTIITPTVITPTCTFGGISPNCNSAPSTSTSGGGGLNSTPTTTTTVLVPTPIQTATQTSMSTTFDVSLKYGSKGDAVEQLQDFLQDQGMFTGKIDGRFGLGTRKAVIAFQLANGLKGDGYFGLGSRNKASAILAEELKPSMDAEQTETGNVSMIPGCTSTSAYSATTGQSCH